MRREKMKINYKRHFAEIQKILKKCVKLGKKLDRWGIPLDISFQNETMLRQIKEKSNA